MNVHVVKGAASVVFAQHHGDRKPHGQVILIGTRPEILSADTYIKNQDKK